MRWNADADRAYLAGLLHDICKELPQSEQKQMAQKSQLDVTNEELSIPNLWHAIAGAWFVEYILEIKDKDIINAIRYHTVARAGMTRLEEIVYVADLISADRTYSDVDKIRKMAYVSLDRSMLVALSFSVTDIVNKASKLPSHTVEAYNQYTLIKK